MCSRVACHASVVGAKPSSGVTLGFPQLRTEGGSTWILQLSQVALC